MLAMSFLKTALAFTFLIAVTASVFAIWPVVADAPWEDDTGMAVEDRTDDVRCQGALDYRTAALANPPTRAGSLLGSPGVVSVTDQAALEQLLEQAEREIAMYC